MIVPSSAILVPLLAAFVLSALSYYKKDPVRRLTSGPFVMLVTPVLLLFTFLALGAAGAVGALVSIPLFVVSLATFAVAVRQARCLLPKPKPG